MEEMSAPLVFNLSFSRFDADLATDPSLWQRLSEHLERNGGRGTVVLTDRTLYDVRVVLFRREDLLSLSAEKGVSRSEDEDDWDLFWKVVDVLLSDSDSDGYLFVPPEIVGTDFGAVLFYRSVA